MPDRPWKRVEREVAGILRAERIPVPGRHGAGADPGDVALAGYYVEVRARRRVELWSWRRGIRTDALLADKEPVLVLKEPVRGGELVAIVSLRHFAGLLEELRHRRAQQTTPGEVARV